MSGASGSFSFVHVADLHLDTPFKGLQGLAPEVAEALREASLSAFDAIVALALERGATFVLFAGDIYDGAERGLRAQLRFRDGLARLDAAGIQSFVVYGNHDPVATGWSAVATWPKLVTVFAPDAVEVVPVVRDGAMLATVQGISYEKPAVTENLARRFHRPSEDAFHIGLLHCNVEGSPGEHANYSPCSLNDLAQTGLDYLALGHVHQRRVLAGTPGIPGQFVVYPGNTQARIAKSTEQEPKGAYVVSVKEGIVSELEFVACDKVRFVQFDCDVTGLSDLGELDETLREAGQRQLAENDGRSVVARVRLVGRGAVHAELARRGVRGDLLKRLRDMRATGDQFLWWDELQDATSAVLELSEIRGRGDFAADLLELAEDLRVDAPSRLRLIETVTSAAPKVLAPRLLSLLESDEELEDIVARATTLALDLLAVEEK